MEDLEEKEISTDCSLISNKSTENGLKKVSFDINYFNGKKRSSLSQNEKDLTALLFYCLVNCDI